MNPFIYVLTNAAFVSAFKKLLKQVTGINLDQTFKDGIVNSEVTRQSNNYSEDDSYQMKDHNTQSGKKYKVKGTVNNGVCDD